MMDRKKLYTCGKVFLFVAWAVMFAGLLSRDHLVARLEIQGSNILKQSKEESFVGVYFQGERIGFVKQRLQQENDHRIQLHQEGFLKLNIMGQSHPVRMRLDAGLAETLLLMDFVFHLDSPFYVMDVAGEVKGATLVFTMDTGKEKISETLSLKSRPFIATQQRTYLLQSALQPGKKFKVPFFDPVSMAVKESLLEYMGKEKILIKDRIHNLHHFTETFSGMRISSWLDDSGKVIKEESPAGFIFLSEPEFLATSLVSSGTEILGAAAIFPSGSVAGLSARNSASYEIEMIEQPELKINDQRQHWQQNTLTVTREPALSTAGNACDDSPGFLASTMLIQSNHSEISDLAAKITTMAQAQGEAVIMLSRWVYDNLEKRPVIGLPDALTTLRNRRGDCNEHASLFAALARSRGIPTRIAAGVTLQQDSFYYHAWNEVCIDNQWTSVDTTTNQLPVDVSHIKFVAGGNEEMIRIAALIGNVSIAILPEKKDVPK